MIMTASSVSNEKNEWQQKHHGTKRTLTRADLADKLTSGRDSKISRIEAEKIIDYFFDF